MRKGKGSDLHFDGGMREKEKVSKLFLKKQELSSSDDGKRRRTLKKKKTSKEQKRNVMSNLVKRGPLHQGKKEKKEKKGEGLFPDIIIWVGEEPPAEE